MIHKLVFFVVLVLICGCAKPSTAQKGSVELKQDCYKDRKIERIINDISARIEFFGDDVLIATSDARYMPCVVPEAFRKNGVKIVFSGEIREVYQQERWAGLPLHLINIRQGSN